jgi:urea transport system permease protein
MRRLLVLLVVAWLAGPPASHAQSPEAVKALADLVVDDADKREAAIAVIGGTRDPKWLEFLAALRDGNVYARGKSKDAEVVVGGAKTTKGDAEVIEIASAYERKPLGAVPLTGLVEIAADRRLRIAIKPFLDADETRVQLESPDPEARRGAAMKLGHQAAAGAAPVVEAAIKKEAVPAVRHALEEALALIRLAHGDAAVRILAAQSLGALHSSDAVPALQKLAADTGA